ncbi:MAG: hypothetical protein SOR77_00740 [Peptoniphilus sp.]|uniref:hypothetical protein n=1 Tax=Peptoniphilus sp. TaxID=1971214 RepID=UPI002A76208F|nr:hypothetical protein [Peptoniphilus sp.]MDY2986136.1 hypothetical protein [Peptoniphilus sp.]
MAGAIARGLTLEDFYRMTIGQIVDYCITFNEINNNEEEKKEETRTATQHDFNNF